MPALYVPYNHRRMGLYTAQVVYRKIGYPGGSMYSYDACRISVPLTTDILNLVRKITLNLVRKITLNFINIPTGADPSATEPPLHIFLQFLTLQKRDKADPVLVAWIKERYDGESATLRRISIPVKFKRATQLTTNSSHQPTPSKPSIWTSSPVSL
jgi:hypothetical protein